MRQQEKSGGYKSYDKMKSVDGIQVLRQMILNFKRAGVDEIVLITGYQAEQVEKKLAKLGAVFLRSEDYEKEEMITSAVRGMNYLKPRCEKILLLSGRSFSFHRRYRTCVDAKSERK